MGEDKDTSGAKGRHGATFNDEQWDKIDRVIADFRRKHGVTLSRPEAIIICVNEYLLRQEQEDQLGTGEASSTKQ